MTASLNAGDLLALQRAAFLLGPLLVAAVLVLACRPTPREAVGAMVAFLWQLPALLALHLAATEFQWWSFGGDRNMLVGLPIDVWIGWAVWWGPVAVFVNRWLSIPAIIAVSVLIDVVTMPYLSPLVETGPYWIVGDAAAMALCLGPALWVAKLTRMGSAPNRRAMFHVLGWGGYLSLVIPISVLSYLGQPLSDLYHLPEGPLEWCLVAAGLFLLFVGISATAEFARVGNGTPIPFDPPKRVVTTGPYAFTANPMQIISAFFMAVLALYARSWGLAFIALMFAIFDTVYATWYNRAHIALAMPTPWSRYRAAVREWRWRWHPHVDEAAEVSISANGPARRAWDLFWPQLSRAFGGNVTVRNLASGTSRRLVYSRPADGVEDHGVKAAGRILEHGPVPVAILGWLLRFPYLGGALDRFSGLAIVVWRRHLNNTGPR